MSYIGRQPTVGNFQICDAISVVNGQAAYTMQVGSVNVLPETANHMIVSLNGVIQKPNSSFTVSGSTITFASNLVTNDVIDFIQILGDVLDLGVPSDATVTDAKTNFVSTSSAAGLQIKGDGTTDGTLQLNCSQNSHGIKIKSPPHSAGASYTLTMPNNDGDANQFLQTNGSGVLSFAAAGGGVDGIVSSANATAITINSDEIVTLSSVPAFSAGLTTSSYSPSASTFYVFNDVSSTAHFNQGGHYSTSTGKFTAPVAGVYYFYCSMIWESVGDGDTMHDAWRFRKNDGTSLHYDNRRAEYVNGTTGNSGYYTTHQSTVIKLAASDTFGVYVGSNSASQVVHDNTNFTYFQGFLIG